MSTFEFVTILLSIVVGLGITRLLSGLGRAIEIHGQLRIYWIQVIWSINVGLYLIFFWWTVIFGYSDVETWNFTNFVHLLLYAILLYLQAALILPLNLKPGMDLETHFFSVRKWFFSIGILLPIVELSDSLMHGLDNLLVLGPIYIFLQCSGIILSVIARLTTNRIFHGMWCLVYLAAMLLWQLTQFWSIG